MGNSCPGNAYFTAPKRLSNEFDDTIGADPATRLSSAAGKGAGAAEAVSEADGFSAGLAAACLVSAFGAPAGCGVSVRLASITFGFAGGSGAVPAVLAVLAVASAVPPMPTLRARLLKNPSDCAFGAAFATRVGPAVGAGAAAAIFGSCGARGSRLSDGARGGLAAAGMVPGAPAIESSEKLGPSRPPANAAWA